MDSKTENKKDTKSENKKDKTETKTEVKTESKPEDKAQIVKPKTKIDYLPPSSLLAFLLTYKCINRECNVESEVTQLIDTQKSCIQCKDKNVKFSIKFFKNKFKKSLDDWESTRGIILTKECSYDMCKYIETTKFSFEKIHISKCCQRCGSLAALTYLLIDKLHYKSIEPIKFAGFECEKCNLSWETTCYWKGYKQQCSKCKTFYLPLDISCELYNCLDEKSKFKVPKFKEIEKHHKKELCERCDLLKKNCYDINQELEKEINERRTAERYKILGIKIEEKKENEKKEKAGKDAKDQPKKGK